MDEYINRDVLLKAVEKMDRLDKETKTKYEYNKEGYILLLKSAPAADVAPVVHAHWVTDFDFDPEEERELYFYFCSKCKEDLFGDKEDFKYCPYCGAQMDEKI